MSQASPTIHNLARRLLVFEAAPENASGPNETIAVQVIEKLRLRLVKFAGVEGFRSLLSRALTLAKADVPFLQRVQIREDGSLEGFLENLNEEEEAQYAGTVLVARLLELLITFIGEPLTLQLMRDAWPNADWGTQPKTEETP